MKIENIKICNTIQNVINEVADVSVYCTSIMCNFNTGIMKVATLVPAACSYPYSSSTIYRNISNLIYGILEFSTNAMFLYSFLLFLFCEWY
jgi:hypothetical protein